jgi:DNA-directed RNA polymerase subunit N (RpoN/RPB10)
VPSSVIAADDVCEGRWFHASPAVNLNSRFWNISEGFAGLLIANTHPTMLIPARCMSCGLPVGDVAGIYRRIRYERAREALKDRDVIPTQAVIDASLQIDMEDILEELGITEDCCRRTLTTGMCFQDYY